MWHTQMSSRIKNEQFEAQEHLHSLAGVDQRKGRALPLGQAESQRGYIAHQKNAQSPFIGLPKDSRHQSPSEMPQIAQIDLDRFPERGGSSGSTTPIELQHPSVERGSFVQDCGAVPSECMGGRCR